MGLSHTCRLCKHNVPQQKRRLNCPKQTCQCKMGKSAKVHKRVPKKLKSSAQSSANSASSSQSLQVQHAQKKASRKNKIANAKGSKDGGQVLGEADYVTLMMSGRRKAKEEAAKLPRSDDG